MLIGEVAAKAGVHVQTVRYYERRGLLRKPSRLASGYRAYSAAELEIIGLIKQSQRLGFTLDEIERLLALRGGGIRDGEEVRALCQSKIGRIDDQIRQLQRMRFDLQRLLDRCDCGATQPVCRALILAAKSLPNIREKGVTSVDV